MLKEFDWQQFMASFFVLFAIIDIPGSIPYILSLRKRGKIIKPIKTAIMAFCMFMMFYFAGDAFLTLFGVDVPSFALAGSLIIFVMAAEMILDISIFKEASDTPKDISFFPIVFPLVSGAGALTTMLAIRSQFAAVNLISGVAANMVCVYLILKLVGFIEKIVNPGILYMIKKFFGIILLTISIKLFTANIMLIMEKFIDRIAE